MHGNICFVFFFSSCYHNINLLIVTRLFKDTKQFKSSCWLSNIQQPNFPTKMKKVWFFCCVQISFKKIGWTHSRNLFEFTWNSEAACSPELYYKETCVFLQIFKNTVFNHGDVILNRSNKSSISIETSVPQQAGGFIIKRYFGTSNYAGYRTKMFPLGSMAKNRAQSCFPVPRYAFLIGIPITIRKLKYSIEFRLRACKQ